MYYCLSFIDNVLGCLRKPSEDEAVLGSRLLAILAIIFGNDEERFFQRSKAVLNPLIKTAKNAKVKVAVRDASYRFFDLLESKIMFTHLSFV